MMGKIEMVGCRYRSCLYSEAVGKACFNLIDFDPISFVDFGFLQFWPLETYLLTSVFIFTMRFLLTTF